MDKPDILNKLEAEAKIFITAISGNFYDEYWISDRHTCEGLLAVNIATGHMTLVDKGLIEAYWQWEKDEEQRKWREREDARRAALSPENRKREDELNDLQRKMSDCLTNHIAEQFVKSLSLDFDPAKQPEYVSLNFFKKCVTL